MSEWFRSFQRSGEKPKPVHARSVQVPASIDVAPVTHEAPAAHQPSTAERELARVKSDLLKVEAELGAGAAYNRHFLKQRKAVLVAKLIALKQSVKAEHIATSLDQSVAYAERHGSIEAVNRACAIIAILRSIVMDIEEQNPADKEAIRMAGQFLKERGFLP